jgi:urea transporter
MAIGGVFFLFSNRVLILAILCGILCTLLTGTLAGLFPEGVPVATLPFCLGTTVFIISMNNLPKIKTFSSRKTKPLKS